MIIKTTKTPKEPKLGDKNIKKCFTLLPKK